MLDVSILFKVADLLNISGIIPYAWVNQLKTTNMADWINLIGSAANGVNGIIGNIIAGSYNKKQQKDAQAWAEKMQDKTNEYNLPINQVARLKEAGINPNLAFGSAASAMGSSVGSVPHYPESQDWSGALRSGINDYFSRRFERAQVLSQLREQNADIDKKEMDNETQHLLLEDYRALKRSEYGLGKLKNEVDSSLYERKAGLETDYLSAKWLNEMDKYFAHVPQALSNHYRAQDELLRTRKMSEFEDYLTKRSKGRYERGYYDKNLNPYETSTVAGLLRTVLGIGKTIVETPTKPLTEGQKLKKGISKTWKDLNSFNSFGEFLHALQLEAKKYWKENYGR